MQSSDPSSNPLQRPELNPLLNPLLAENMNRWAEVYFNNPPERREQAVVELLCELEAQRAQREATTVAPRATFHNAQPAATASTAQVPSVRPAHEQAVVPCESCGRNNPITHKFCGMCGETLHPGGTDERASDVSRYAEEGGQEDRSAAEPESERGSESNQQRVTPLSGLSPRRDPQETDGEYDAVAAYDWSRPRPYRIYIGGVLVIVLLALGYTAWRASQNSHASDAPSSTPAVTSKMTSPAATPSTSTLPEETKRNRADTSTRGRMAPTNADIGAPNQSAGGGSDELAQAERYLNATNGRGRDSAAAAQLLWTSIAKHNGPATLLLADLYLKGDGVEKNCDQARVLLDAAARKGVSGAGDRLRNMQAFGCQ